MVEVVRTKTVSEQKVGTANGTADKYRESYIKNGTVTDGSIPFEELEGKIIMYVDRECKIKTERVWSVDATCLRTKNAVGKRFRVSKNQIIFAYLRKNGNPKVVM